MNIVLLSAAYPLQPSAVAAAHAELGLSHGDLLWMVSWRRPTGPLPVDRHLVLGPFGLFLRGAVTDVATTEPELLDESRAPADATDLEEAFAQESLGPSPVSTVLATAGDGHDGDESQEDNTGPAAEPASTSLGDLSYLPHMHPRRLRQAVAWRTRRLRRAVRVRAKRLVRTRAARFVLNLEVSVGFAAACWRAPAVMELLEQADLVIALDVAAYRGAWVLTKRVAAPAVVVGLPAGKRFREGTP